MTNTGNASVLEKASEMQQALNKNSGQINVLHDRVEELKKKLDPVLRQIPATADGSPAPCNPPSSVPVILQIENETSKVQGMIHMIEDLLVRLPL